MDLLEKMAKAQLEECKAGKRGWYYISMASEERFEGGFLFNAFGPTDALRYLHTFRFYVPGCSTRSTGPVTDEDIKNVPQDKRWCRLTKEEVEKYLG